MKLRDETKKKKNEFNWIMCKKRDIESRKKNDFGSIVTRAEIHLNLFSVITSGFENRLMIGMYNAIQSVLVVENCSSFCAILILATQNPK